MNKRQFKKLCKQAANVMVNVSECYKSQLFYSDSNDEFPEIGMKYKWERNTIKQNWRGKGEEPDMLPKRIAGFGCVSGYYEPEWEDCDALSTLIRAVIDSFTDWGTCDVDKWPDNHCPVILKKSRRHAIAYAKVNLIKTEVV